MRGEKNHTLQESLQETRPFQNLPEHVGKSVQITEKSKPRWIKSCDITFAASFVTSRQELIEQNTAFSNLSIVRE